MRICLSLFVLTAFLLVSGCKSSTDPSSSLDAKTLIVGVWKIKPSTGSESTDTISVSGNTMKISGDDFNATFSGATATATHDEDFFGSTITVTINYTMKSDTSLEGTTKSILGGVTTSTISFTGTKVK